VGLELEAHLVDLDRPAARVPWGRLTAALAALPPLPGGSRVTVEPGGQVELSGPPAPGAGPAVAALRADRAVVAAALAGVRLGLAPVGADPLRPPARVCPAPRYRAMEQHFAAVGCGGPGTAMMTATASLQVNLDAGPPGGWSRRVALAHQLGPVLVAVSACSPLLGGRATGWRSSRQQVWGALDQARCGPLLGGDDPAGEWAHYALAAPVMLVRDPDTGAAEPVLTRTRFADWVTGAVPLGGRRPTAADLDYHLSTLFPPVRPRGWMEIRYLDALPSPWWEVAVRVVTSLLAVPVAEVFRAIGDTAPLWHEAADAALDHEQLATAADRCFELALRHDHDAGVADYLERYVARRVPAWA
jgi:glutamate--cysteine ligase